MKDVIERWVLPMEERFNRRLKKLVNEKMSLRCGLARCINETGRINTAEQNWTPLLVSERAAQIKKEVKALGGNSFLLRGVI